MGWEFWVTSQPGRARREGWERVGHAALQSLTLNETTTTQKSSAFRHQHSQILLGALKLLRHHQTSQNSKNPPSQPSSVRVEKEGDRYEGPLQATDAARGKWDTPLSQKEFIPPSRLPQACGITREEPPAPSTLPEPGAAPGCAAARPSCPRCWNSALQAAAEHEERVRMRLGDSSPCSPSSPSPFPPAGAPWCARPA